VEHGPLPPHERTWRHPSELAAEEQAIVRAQGAAPSTRVFALTTGSLGLLAVGVLILTVTPRGHDAPIAISATTTPVAIAAPETRVDSLRPAFATRGSGTTEMASLQHALATPIGDGRTAVITDNALKGHDGDEIEVRLPSGRLAAGQVIEKSGSTWLIELYDAESGHEIATDRPASSEIVTVMMSPPVTVVLADIGTLDIGEGTAVLDRDGNLVGICTHRKGDGKVRLIEVRAELVGATSGVP
jgi:hypothetical protein